MDETVYCPIACVKSGCSDPPDFLEKHNGFLLTLIGMLGGGFGVLLGYFLKSRCTKLQFGCCSCDRDPLELTSADLNTTDASRNDV